MTPSKRNPVKTPPWTPQEDKTLLELRAKQTPLAEIAKTLGRTERAVGHHSWKLSHRKVPGEVQSIADTETPVTQPPIELPQPTFGHLPLSVINSGDWIRYGLVADTHLCCKEERLAELHAQYELFQREGIQIVFHAGNPIDGYVPRINGESVFTTTIDGQAQYFADNYPSVTGIDTHFITGDDHESWFSPGFNIGAYLEFVARKAGRTDLHYLGHVEADVDMQVKGAPRPTILKIQHPGGGSAYSRSYKGQKQVEAFEGGEKPDILVQGHYHVSNFMNERNIWVVSMPGFQDQTIFARKKNLRMEVGGALLEFKVNPADGAVTRCRLEFNRFFTRGYYKKFIRSDATLVKGKLVLNA